MKFKEGIYEGLDYPTYASIPAVRSHDLTDIVRCPFTWKNLERKESPALHEGRVQHTVFLEHEKFFDEFALEPNVDRRTKAGKAEYNEWLEGLGDKTPCKPDLYETCLNRRAVIEDFVPKPEHSVELTICFYWCGQPCKAKLDWHTGTDVWDLKTCRDASPRGFLNAINTFRYHQQAAYYIQACRAAGLPTNKFYFLAQEKAQPYPYAVYTLDDEAIAYADSANERAMALLLKCREQDEYKPFGLSGEVEFSLSDLR